MLNSRRGVCRYRSRRGFARNRATVALRGRDPQSSGQELLDIAQAGLGLGVVRIQRQDTLETVALLGEHGNHAA